MASDMNEILHPGTEQKDPDFPHAPTDWTRASAIAAAEADGISLGPDH